MLDNIKLILGIDDSETKYDNMIMLYISKVTSSVVDYCNVSELVPGLESFIEDKVADIMRPRVQGGTQNTGEVKAVTRGDTRIEYNVGSSTVDMSKGANLTDADRKYLNTYRVARMY